jgi:hypothetical protein
MSYNVRGWLKGINKDGLNAEENDLFSMQTRLPGGRQLLLGQHQKAAVAEPLGQGGSGPLLHVFLRPGQPPDGCLVQWRQGGENYSLSGMQYDKNGNILS